MSRTYSISHYAKIHAVETEHFWFVARNEMIRSLILQFIPAPRGSTFLDIGCGTGVMLGILERAGFTPTGLDINARAIAYALAVSNAAFVRQSVFTYVPRRKFAAVGVFDVVEHVEDDIGFFKRCHTFLTPSGYLFLTVPANPRLWSEIDALSGHQRRYTKNDVQTKLEQSGFRILFLGHWNTLLLPVYALWRMMTDRFGRDAITQYLTVPTPLVNRIFLGILRLEGRLLRGHAWFGASLVVVAQKI